MANPKSRQGFLSLSLLILSSTLSQAHAAVGELLWEDNFNTLNTDTWNIDVGDGCDQGLCGWGNQELQWYGEDNVSITAIPGEPGNQGLLLQARNQAAGTKSFTSGKIQSKNKLSVQYGMVEIRMQVSNVETGLWPALWMLGTSTATWPAKGEIDIMEMGQSASARADAGHPGAAANNYTGSNLIFYADEACTPENPSCAASTAWQTDNAHVSSSPLTNRFVTYRLYWTDTQIRFTVEDNGVEYDMYDQPFTISQASDEFQQPFYLLMNLAVGGNFTDALSDSQVTAPLPASMIVDYVRVYKLDGLGAVFEGNLLAPEYGTFGVYTDTTSTDNSLTIGEDADLYVWNQTSVTTGNDAPFEGSNVIAWHYTPTQWFGGGIQSRQARDMSQFRDGALRFRIKIPADVGFKVGIADTYTNENWVNFPANTSAYSLVRNGDWAEAVIPVDDLAGPLVALQSLQGLFYIASLDGQIPNREFDFAIDDIRWTGGGAPSFSDADNDGVPDSSDQCPDTPAGSSVDATGCSQVSAVDYTDLPGAFSAQYNDSPANEDISKAFDNQVQSKYLTFHASAWIQYQIEGAAYPATGYRLTSANDAPSRDPLSWTLEGSNDASQWSILDSRSNEDFANRFETREFSFSNTRAYQYYRLSMLNNSGSITQLAEWDILGPDAPAAVDSDGDGVADTSDNCPDTPAGVQVGADGCAVQQDADNDGIADNADACPDTPDGAQVGNDGCPTGDDSFGITSSGDGAVTFFVNTAGWADVHYTVNNGTQQNVRMTIVAGRNELSLNNLSDGDTITFWYTFQKSDGSVTDTSAQTYVVTAVAPVADSDGDGVSDNNDMCPGTPPGETVDTEGCPQLYTPSLQIEAEEYTAYSDSDAGNTGGVYRTDDVDIEATSDNGGGYNVGWMVSGEWLEYPLALGPGTYTIFTRVASESGGGGLDVLIDGQVTGNDTINATGGWQAFETHNAGQVTITDSVMRTLRINVTGGNVNLNWIRFELDGTSGSDTDSDGVSDTQDQCPGTAPGTAVDSNGCPLASAGITPLYDATTLQEQPISYDRGDALITRFADRGRDRHAKEDQFQIYDHYLSHYWTHRTAQFEIADFVAKGGDRIEVTFVTEWKLGAREFRAWYRGLNTVAEYHGNYFGGGAVVELDHGTYDFNFNKISDSGDQYRYQVIINDYRPLNWEPANGTIPLAIGQRMEFEPSQFLDAVPEGRNNYYGTTYLYVIGEGLKPWKTAGDFANKSSEREDSYPIAEAGWLGGHTTLPYNYTHEPDNHFMQMATNLSNVNGQNFVEGRRVHHSSFVDGRHDEHVNENGVFSEVAGKSGPHYIHENCAGCHVRNGRAAPAEVGVPLDKWVFRVADLNGNTHPLLGNVLQPENTGIDPAQGEGEVSIARWIENNGLRSPEFTFSGVVPERFSARIAPQLVGIGLLEAIPESAILAREDINDTDGNGISGKAQRITEPGSNLTRLGRFGWKAGKVSVAHQVNSAFNTDMGVGTSMLPAPDCGSQQSNCGSSGSEISDELVTKLVKYVSLLGVRAQRSLDDPAVQNGRQVFRQAGCESCHTETWQTSDNHPLSELRAQTIHPYTDMLLHDMGPGLADSLGEDDATGAEWRTTPLWGLGLSACVTGGVINPLGGQGNEVCNPVHSYLHDGRARSIEEAILWHDGEAQSSRVTFESLSASDKSDLLTFLRSL